MSTKTLTFNFVKKTKFKLSKDNYVNKSGKKKVLGLQAMSIIAGRPYHLGPVKISKNELSVSQKGKELEIDGLLKFKVNVKDPYVSEFNDALKNKKIALLMFGFNTDPTPGIEITLYDFSNPNKTSNFIEIS